MFKNPIDFIQYRRFDLLFKYLYIKAREESLQTTYYEEMYRHHLEIWNQCNEFDNPNKNNYEDFKRCFHDISDSIKTKGFDSSISTVRCDENCLINGSHRVAACILHRKNVDCTEQVTEHGGQIDTSFYFFKKRYNIRADYCDRAAIEYVKFKDNTFIVTVFPSAVKIGQLDQVRNILTSRGNIVYEKQVNLNQLGALNFMKELYYKEEWAEANNRVGYATKRDYCFPDETPMHTFLVEFDSVNTAQSTKEEIREIYKMGKHSIHINDRHEETVRLSKCLFNDNSIDFMNQYNGVMFPLYKSLLSEFTNYIDTNCLDRDNYCITSGTVLSTCGLRECNDLDYLHHGPELKPKNDLTHSHNEYGVGKYHTSKDDIIFNPDHHFYHFNVKFSSLDTIKKLKEKRNEPKDIKDVGLINSTQET